MRDPDRVGDLDLAAVGEARGDHVLGHPARRVGGGAVDLGRVLAREGAAAVASHAAVGVDDDLAAREPRVADRAADHEAPGGVDEEVLLRVQLALVVELGRQDRVQHVLPEVGANQRVAVDPVAMLGRDQDLLDLDRLTVLVADRDLGLAVRAQVGDDLCPCGPRRAAGRACGRARSASASAPASRASRSRTSSPGRRPRRRRARRRRPGRCATRARCRRPGRCRATACRSR